MRGFLAIVSLAAMMTPAVADWQYAKWGMTATQIMQASKGRAAVPPPGDAYVCPYVGQRLLAVSPRQEVGGMLFNVTFCSVGTANTLGAILLAAESGTNVFELKRALIAQYGAPVTSARGSMTWRDTKARNTITYTDFGGVAGRVDYRPIGGTGF